MKTFVGFKNLKINCFIGILKKEKRKKQPIFIDVSCSFHLEKLQETIDYVILKNICKTIALSKKYDLLEELAYDIIKEIKKVKNKLSIQVCIKKPQALPGADHAFVILEDNES